MKALMGFMSGYSDSAIFNQFLALYFLEKQGYSYCGKPIRNHVCSVELTVVFAKTAQKL